MDKRWISRLVWALAAACIVLAAVAFGLFNRNSAAIAVPAAQYPRPMNMTMAVTFPLVAAVILASRPRHAIGWIFMVIGAGQAVSQISKQYAFYALEVVPGTLPGGVLAFWIQEFVWFPSFCLFILLLVLFPDGKPLTPRWRRFVGWIGASFVVFCLSIIIESQTDPMQVGFLPEPVDPFGPGDTIFDLAVFMMLFSVPVAVAGLVKRLRRAGGVERQQLKWFSFAGLVFVVVFIVLSVLSAWPVLEESIVDSAAYQIALRASQILFPITVALFPLAVGLAIQRYRLYDIDLIIRRTMIYSLVTLVLGLVFGITVMFSQQIIFRLTSQQESELATVLSTLFIAGLYSPLRERIQQGIDRRFYRQKYDAEQTLAAFGAEIQNEVDLDALVVKVEAVVAETLQPEIVQLVLLPQASREKSESVQAS